MVVAGIIAASVPVIAGSTIQAIQANRARSNPKIKPGEFLRVALEIQALTERGLSPVLSADPFSLNTVLFTEDQSGVVFDILGTRFASQALAATPEESAAVFAAREAFIQSAPGFPDTVPEVPTLREEVVAALSPATAKVVAPGVVAKKSSGIAMSTRLGGPCAAANTGFARLNCARGGFS